jgi:SCY1-like protein 1
MICYQSRAKVLTAAFARALRDPFVHARNAALLSFAATADVFSDEDCATKILPGICASLIDKEKQAFAPIYFSSPFLANSNS